MEAVINALAKLITAIGQNILPAVILMATVSILGIVVFAHFNLQHIMDRFPTIAQEQNQFHRSVILNDLIITELQDVQKYGGADRVNLNQFRNGQFDLVGVPFNFIGISFSASAPGISLDDRVTTPIPLSVYNDIIPVMWHDPQNPICVSRDIEQITHPVLRFRMQERGTQFMLTCPVTTPSGAAVGFISVEYLRRESKRPSEEQLGERVLLSAQRVVSYLIRTVPRV